MIVIFAGPTLSAAEVRDHLPEAQVKPPVSQGQVYRAVQEGARAMGIVDGYFDRVPAVWHKEILWALSRDIPVYGSASMGALRAAELADHGMRGVGEIFEALRDGILEDDDEVAVAHGPPETGYRAVSVPMVDVRATLARAREQGAISSSTAEALLVAAKGVFYAERTYGLLLSLAANLGISVAEIASLREWLKEGAVNAKRADAVAMLQRMRVELSDGRGRPGAPFHFEHTDAWDIAAREVDEQLAAEAGAQSGGADAQAGALEALLNEELLLFAPYAIVRALDKQRMVGASEAGMAAQANADDAAVAWYFEQRLGRTVPESLEEYAREIGMQDAAAFRSAVRREYDYVHTVPQGAPPR